MALEIQTNPYARGIAGGGPAKYMLMDVDRVSGPFPRRRIISEHKTMAAAEKAMAKRCRRCGAGPLHPNRQPACHECGAD